LGDAASWRTIDSGHLWLQAVAASAQSLIASSGAPGTPSIVRDLSTPGATNLVSPPDVEISTPAGISCSFLDDPGHGSTATTQSEITVGCTVGCCPPPVLFDVTLMELLPVEVI
jgi:hypothetical protein